MLCQLDEKAMFLKMLSYCILTLLKEVFVIWSYQTIWISGTFKTNWTAGSVGLFMLKSTLNTTVHVCIDHLIEASWYLTPKHTKESKSYPCLGGGLGMNYLYLH